MRRGDEFSVNSTRSGRVSNSLDRFEDGIIQIGRPLAEMNAVLESLRLRTLLLVTGVTLAAGALEPSLLGGLRDRFAC